MNEFKNSPTEDHDRVVGKFNNIDFNQMTREKRKRFDVIAEKLSRQ